MCKSKDTKGIIVVKCYVCTNLGEAKDIKLKLSVKVGVDVELNRKKLCASRWSKERICNTSGTGKGVECRGNAGEKYNSIKRFYMHQCHKRAAFTISQE